jgi:hypothetical protein
MVMPLLVLLPSYAQAEVEGYFTSNGYLLSTYHLQYWMGANISDAIYWPNFTWVDPYTPGPINSSYEHWGRYQPGQETEPNFNYNAPPELCVVGNYTQAYFNPLAWGWADDNCNNKHPFMCKMLREWLQTLWRLLAGASICGASSFHLNRARPLPRFTLASPQPPLWPSATLPASPTPTSSTPPQQALTTPRPPATVMAATW